MTDISKLANLFTANQRLTAYNTSSKKRTDEQKELADINGDGKVNSADKKLIDKAIKEAKNQNVFDLNDDGKVDINDWMLFGDEIDLDNDGEVSEAEKKFIATQKKSMATTVAKSVKSDKYTGEFNGKMYKDGKVLTGFADNGKYYVSGSLKTGTVSIKENGKSVSYYFVNGEKAEGNIKSGNTTILYKGGLKYTGINEEDGLCYKDGKLANKVVIGGKYYLNGVASAGTYGGKLYDENGLANGLVTKTVNKKEVTYMYKDGVKLTGFADDGKYYASGSLKTGTVSIKENGKSVSYYFVNGEKAQGKVGNYLYKAGQKYTGTNEEDGLYYSNGALKTGNVKDGNTTTNYKKGVLQYSVTDNNTTKTYPNQSGQAIRFKNGNKYVTVKLELGSSAVINSDGTVEITDKDNNKVKYNSAGNLIKETPVSTPTTNTTSTTSTTKTTGTTSTTQTTGTTSSTGTTTSTQTTGTTSSTGTTTSTGTTHSTSTTGSTGTTSSSGTTASAGTTSSTSSTQTTGTTTSTQTTGTTSSTGTTTSTGTTSSTQSTATSGSTNTTESTQSTSTTYTTGTTITTSAIKLPNISFPTIPEEKGTYENGTLILYDTKTNDDGTTSKIWTYAYDNTDNSRTVTQNYSATGGLINTVVEDYETDDKENEYLYTTTFNSSGECTSKSGYATELLGDGNITITTMLQPDVTVEPMVKVEKVKLATTVSSTEKIEENPANILLQSLAELPQLSEIKIGNYTVNDLIKYEEQLSINNMENYAIIYSGFELMTDFLSLLKENLLLGCIISFCEYSSNEQGLITTVNLKSYETTYNIEYNENNQIASISYNVLGNVNGSILYSRDKNGRITSIKVEQDSGSSLFRLESIKINIDSENSVTNSIEYNRNGLITTYNSDLDIININAERYSYDQITKCLTITYPFEKTEIYQTNGKIACVPEKVCTYSDGYYIMFFKQNGQDDSYQYKTMSDGTSGYVKLLDNDTYEYIGATIEEAIKNHGFYLGAEDIPSLNIEKQAQTPLPEEWGKKAVESMTTEEMATEVGQYYDWLIANDDFFDVDFMFGILYSPSCDGTKDWLLDVKSRAVASASEELMRDIRTKVAILDSSSKTDGKSTAVESDSAVGTYVSGFDTGGSITSPTVDELKSELSKALDSAKGTSFSNNNAEAIKKASDNLTEKKLDEIIQKINKKCTPDLQVDFSTQEGRDCWLLATINTFIDDGANGLKDFVHTDNAGNYTVTFKPCNIYINNTEVTVTNAPITITEAEINAPYYKNMALANGDADVNAIEIAYYKLCEQNGLPLTPGNSITAGMKMFYGEFTYKYGSSYKDLEKDWDLKTIKDIKNAYFKDNIIETCNLQNIGKNATATTEKWSELTNAEYTKNLFVKSIILEQLYDKSVVIDAVADCSTKGESVKIPDKDNNPVEIFNNHVYTIAGYTPGENGKSGYVKLINPHDSSVTIEISEIYFKLLFDGMAWAD